MELIDKAAVVAEIRKRLLPVIRDRHYDEWEQGRDSERIAILDIIDTLEVKEVQEYEQPDFSYFETTYKCGKKPHWNVGDTLAYYEFCSDREGEQVLGKVANVRFDEEQSDWIYTFEDGCLYEEELLLDDEVYKKK